MHSASN